MNVLLDSLWLSELLAARTAVAAVDGAGTEGVATAVLGPERCGRYRALDVPVADWWTVSQLAERSGEGRARDALSAYVDVLVADRCRTPGDDVISDLIAHEVDGSALTADEVRAVAVALLCGGAPPPGPQPV